MYIIPLYYKTFNNVHHTAIRVHMEIKRYKQIQFISQVPFLFQASYNINQNYCFFQGEWKNAQTLSLIK